MSRRRRGRPWTWLLTLAVLAVTLVGTAWGLGYPPQRLWETARSWTAPPPLATFVVDEGDVPIVIVESGALESSNSTPVKCQVKAILGTVGSALGGIGNANNGSGGGGRGGSGGSSGAGGGTAGGAGGAGGVAGAEDAAKKDAAKKDAAKKDAAKKDAAKKGTGMAGADGGATKGATAGVEGMAGATTGLQAPMIQSFTYVVEPYVPLRGAGNMTRTSTVATAGSAQQKGMGGGGGRGGGGRGGGGRGGGGRGGMDQMERQGSTHILTILPEGTPVKAGDVVCTLDSAAFRDEVQAQQIRYAQAKSWVEQAQKMYEVNEIATVEYREGILPQDRLLVRQYIESCKTQLKKARTDLDWGQKVFERGLRSEAQLRADRFALERAEIALQEALVMRRRLDQFTAPRLIADLESKQASIKSDLLAQKLALQQEENRLRDLKLMIEYCTIRAPLDGIVVYATNANAWGRVEDQIREGVSVREGQPIFTIPDPSRMRVKARVNESKVSMIRRGMRAQIRVDAFPDQPMTGTVTTVTAIPAPAAGPISDVKQYFAMVEIDPSDIGGLRPNMSAEVVFVLDQRRKVTRVPVQAIRRVDDRPFVAVAAADGVYHWRELELGAVSPAYAEVRSGLAPGERVVADPDALGTPPTASVRTAANVASTPRG